jgi:obg-like ATPase 1
MIPFSVEWEAKLWQLREDAGARQAFMDETKCVSALPKMVVTGYKELDLIYYFTAGEKEVGCGLRWAPAWGGGALQVHQLWHLGPTGC